MRNLALFLKYDGTAYHGWQVQKNACSVAQTLEEAAADVVGHPVHMTGCGRTDAGVHAEYYVANFRTESRIPVDRVAYALNTHLPADIVVTGAREVPLGFNAIGSCVRKEYTYQIYNSRIRDPFFVNRAWFYPKHLDEAVMQEAAAQFVGTHDFAAVRSVGTDVKSTVRTVYYFDVERRGELILLRVCANGFLYNMVRAMTGTVVYAAEGKIRPQDIGYILDSGNRTAAGPTVPPGGLYMTHLWYDDGEAQKPRRRWPLYLLAVLIVLALLAAFLLTKTHVLDGLKRSLRYLGKNGENYGSVSFETLGSTAYGQLNGGLGVVTGSSVTLFSEEGKQLGSEQHAMTAPVICTGQDRLLCYDAGGNYLTVLDKSGSAVFSQTPEQTIFDADLSSGGYSAMLTAGDSGRSLLQVYDPNGSLLYKRSTKSHYLSACAVSPDGSHAAAVALGQADITFSASLQLYRTDSEEIAAECALGSEMPYDIAFVTDSVVCAVSEDRVRFFAADGTERGAYVAENGRIADYHFGGDGFVTVLVDPYETSSRAELITLQPDGSVLAQLSLSFMPVSLSACGSYVGILTAEKALLYTSALEPVAETEQDGTAVCILARSDGTALLAGTGEANLFLP